MKHLCLALAKAQAASKGVEKDSENSYHRYKYASAEAMLTHGKTCLSDQGLALFPKCANVEGDLLQREYMLIHSSGESLHMAQSWPIVPEKGRPMDKATATAATTSIAYVLRDLLLIPRVEEGTEMDCDQRPTPTKRPAKRATVKKSDLDCPDCKSTVYDNIADRAAQKTKRPALSCSNRECGWVIWESGPATAYRNNQKKQEVKLDPEIPF